MLSDTKPGVVWENKLNEAIIRKNIRKYNFFIEKPFRLTFKTKKISRSEYPLIINFS